MWLIRICPFALVTFLTGALFAQEHGYSPADIENGGRLYAASCASCHGATGDGIAGTNLFRNQFRRASADPDLVNIIRNGIPNTAMPPTSFTESQAGTIVAFLRSMALGPVRAVDVAQGDPSRGKALFEGKGNCLSCHRVAGVGARLAPDLTEVGQLRQAPELQRALLDPDADIRNGNRFVKIVFRNGETITGRLLNQDTFTIQLLDSREQLVSISKAEVSEYSFLKNSPMPSYRNKLSPQEVADLVGYLASLKGLMTQ